VLIVFLVLGIHLFETWLYNLYLSFLVILLIDMRDTIRLTHFFLVFTKSYLVGVYMSRTIINVELLQSKYPQECDRHL